MSVVQSNDQFANAPSSSFTDTTSSPSSSSSSGTTSTHSSNKSSDPNNSPPADTSTSTSPSPSSSSDVTDSSTPDSSSSGANSGANGGSTTSPSQKNASGQSSSSNAGNNAADNAVVPDSPPAVTSSSSSSIPAPTPTTTSSSSHLPSSTSTSTTAAPTSTSTSTHATSTTFSSTSTSSSAPAPTPTATSTSAPASHTHTVISSTDSAGSVVVMTQTIFNPVSTSLPGATGHPGTESSGPNIGAIIGGIAGGLVGVILLTWLILIPIRKRAALKKEVDWMAFGSENDHHNDDSNNDSIYRTPRAGVGETEAKAMDSPEMYAMSDITSAAHQGTLYSHLDANASPGWAGAGAGGGVGSYNVAGNVVGEAPPGQQYDANYAAYYPAAVAVPQQQQQQYGGYASYSDHGSPEMGAQRYAGGQQPWPTTSTSSHGHGQQPSVPVNNYPFAPPTVVSGHSMSRNASLNDRVLLSQANSFSASTATAHDNNGGALSRSASGQALLPPAPAIQAPSGQPPPHKGVHQADAEDDCALAYVLDDPDDGPVPDKGTIPGLHLANPDR